MYSSKGKIFSSILLLGIYWGIVFFTVKKYFQNNYTFENIIGAIEFVSLIAIILVIIIFVSKLFGNILVGIILGLIGTLILFNFIDKFMISENWIEYSMLGLGLIFNSILLFRLISGIIATFSFGGYSSYNYNNESKYENDPPQYHYTEDDILEEYKRQQLLNKINSNILKYRENSKNENRNSKQQPNQHKNTSRIYRK